MPRKKKSEAPAPDTLAAEFAEVAPEELPDDVQQVFDELGGDVHRVTLFRRGRRDTKQAYVGTMDADEFSLDTVARLYGGGRYLARLYGEGTGIVKGLTFYIDEAQGERLQAEHLRASPDRERERHESASGSYTERLLERVLDRLGAQAPAQDPLAVAASLGQVAAQQMAAMVQMIAPLLGGKGGGANASDILDAVRLGVEFSEGKGGDGDGYMSIVREVGKPLVEAVSHLSARERGPNLQTGLPIMTKPGEAPQSAQPTLPPWAQALAPYAGKLAEFAARGDEPSLWAAVLDTQYPRFARWLEQTVTDEARATELEGRVVQYFPTLAPHREWLRAFLREYLPELPDADGTTYDAPDPEPTDGDETA